MRVCRTFLRICMRECVFVCVFACERGGACERKKERERSTWGARNRNDLAREVPRKRDDLFSLSIRRSCDRRIDERENERERERTAENA